MPETERLSPALPFPKKGTRLGSILIIIRMIGFKKVILSVMDKKFIMKCV